MGPYQSEPHLAADRGDRRDPCAQPWEGLPSSSSAAKLSIRVEQRLRRAAREKRTSQRVSNDGLHEAGPGRPAVLNRQLRQARAQLPQLVDLHPLAEPGEANHVGEPHEHVARVADRAGGQLLLAEAPGFARVRRCSRRMFWSSGAILGRNVLAASALRRASSCCVMPLWMKAPPQPSGSPRLPCARPRPSTRVISSRPSSGIPAERSSAITRPVSRSWSLKDFSSGSGSASRSPDALRAGSRAAGRSARPPPAPCIRGPQKGRGRAAGTRAGPPRPPASARRGGPHRPPARATARAAPRARAPPAARRAAPPLRTPGRGRRRLTWSSAE